MSLSIQETAVELIFAAHSTTASAATSLVLQLLHHPEVVERVRVELEAQKLCYNSLNLPSQACGQVKDQSTDLLRGTYPQSQSHASNLSLEKLNQLHYIDCVIKEVLRFLPPVSGGYRTALQTFELDVSWRLAVLGVILLKWFKLKLFYRSIEAEGTLISFGFTFFF